MIRCLIATVLLISIGADALAASDGSGTLSLGLGKIFTFFFLTLGPKAVIAPFARRTSRPPEIPIAPILSMLAGIMVLNLVVMLNAQRIAGASYIGPAFAIVGAVLAVLQAALGVQAVLTGLRLAGVIPGP